MNKFRTIVNPFPVDLSFSLRSQVMLIGSCFSDNIGERMVKAHIPTQINPHGIVFNPLSVARSLEDCLVEKKYSRADLTPRENDFVSLNHHGSFSNKDADELVQKINLTIANSSRFLRDANILIVTLGTSWTYFHHSTNQPVANCHKLPNKNFTKKLIDSSTSVMALGSVFGKLLEANPALKIILTVSPVRHWKDGVVENTLSKSHLLVAANQLANDFEEVYYFPAYEIMLDDLRDYRFYNPDMLHPSPLAVDYIWQKFQETYFDHSMREKVLQIEKLSKVFEHRAKNEEEHQKQIQLARQKIALIVNG